MVSNLHTLLNHEEYWWRAVILTEARESPVFLGILKFGRQRDGEDSFRNSFWPWCDPHEILMVGECWSG